MKRVASYFQNIASKLATFTQSGTNEYQLNNYTVPEYQELTRAHQLLLKEYVRAIAAVSRLSFFVELSEIKLPAKGFVNRLFQILLFKYSPFRLLYLRPLVQLFVESHIRHKLSVLSIIYFQTRFLVQNSLSEKPEYSLWLKEAAQECKEFQETLSTWKIFFDFLKLAFTLIFGLFLAFAGANSLNELLQKIILNALPPAVIALSVFSITIIVVFALYIYLFLDSTFAAKRTIFMGIGSGISPEHNIYLLENNLFKLLGRGKPQEVPFDYIVQSLYYLALVIFFWWMQVQFDTFVSTFPNAIALPCFSVISILFSILLLVEVLSPWNKRHAQGHM